MWLKWMSVVVEVNINGVVEMDIDGVVEVAKKS